MKRNVLWLLSTLSVLALLFGYRTSFSGPLATTSSTSVQSGAFSSSATSGGAGASRASSPGKKQSTGGRTHRARARSRIVSGSSVPTQYGPVQVQLTLTGSKITKASVLQYPHDNSRDVEINNHALPVLTKETVNAQNAHIDMVSGATYTSNGYLRSLQSALDQVRL